MTLWKISGKYATGAFEIALAVGVYLGMAFVPSALAKAGDPAAFAQLIEAAKQEGEVVVDGPPIDTVRSALTSSFREKYGIAVSYISSGSSKSGARVRAERAAGRYLLDVFISGADTPLLTFKPSGWLDSMEDALIDPEVTDTSKWKGNKLWYVDEEKTVLRLLQYVTPNLAINTKLVKPGELTKWTDLLNERWKGKIAAKDPGLTGSGASLTSYFYLQFGPDFVEKLYKKQKPFIFREARQPIQWLAHGTYPIVVGPDHNELKKFLDLGYPVAPVFPTDAPGILSGGWGMLGLVNKAPHPNAAKLFVNWLASKEGLETYSKATVSLSLRSDVGDAWVPKYSVPEEGKEYLDSYGYNFVVKERDPAFEKAKKVLGL